MLLVLSGKKKFRQSILYLFFFYCNLCPSFTPCYCCCFSNLTFNMNCASCDLVADTNTLNCNGSCGKAFHISCLHPKNAQYKGALLPYISKIPNLRWYCDSCLSVPFDSQTFITTELKKQLTDIKLFVDTLLTTLNSSTLTTQNSVGSIVPDAPNPTNNQDDGILNGSFATASSTEPMDHSPSKINSSLHHDSNGTIPSALSSHITTRKRPLQPSPGASPNSKQQKVAAQAQPTSLADMIAKKKPVSTAAPNITLKTNMVRSIYVSPFDPATEPSHIIGHLESNDDLKFIVPDIVCTKLVRINHRVSFVSFKLDVPRHHFDTIVNPDIWPMNDNDEFVVKEFVVKPGNNKMATKRLENPFTKPANTLNRNTNINKRPANNGMSQGGRSHRNNRGREIANQQQPQRQNFQHHCRKLCCNRPRPQYYRSHDHYAENRFDHCPINRR